MLTSAPGQDGSTGEHPGLVLFPALALRLAEDHGSPTLEAVLRPLSTAPERGRVYTSSDGEPRPHPQTPRKLRRAHLPAEMARDTGQTMSSSWKASSILPGNEGSGNRGGQELHDAREAHAAVHQRTPSLLKSRLQVSRANVKDYTHWRAHQWVESEATPAP